MKKKLLIATMCFSMSLLTACGLDGVLGKKSNDSSPFTTMAVKPDDSEIANITLAPKYTYFEPEIEDVDDSKPRPKVKLPFTGEADTDSAILGAKLYASEYDGEHPATAINGNTPYFNDDDLVLCTAEDGTYESFEGYSKLDELGRCRTAYACVGKDLMPTEERGEIGMIKPSGWHTSKYDESVIHDLYLYNRCHLIAYMLTGENANERNLITGTRYLNVEGMLPYEIQAGEYMDSHPDGHILYRVTPIYKGSNLVAEGVIMEAKSLETDELSFCVFCYNVQPGIIIDYATGDNHLKPSPTPSPTDTPTPTPTPEPTKTPVPNTDTPGGNGGGGGNNGTTTPELKPTEKPADDTPTPTAHVHSFEPFYAQVWTPGYYDMVDGKQQYVPDKIENLEIGRHCIGCGKLEIYDQYKDIAAGMGLYSN